MKYVVCYVEANRRQVLTLGGWFSDIGKPRVFHTREQAESEIAELRSRYPGLLGWFSVSEIRE